MNSANRNIELPRCWLLIIFASVLLVMTMPLLTVHADEIEDQLAAGSYVEGEAIAAIRSDAWQMQVQADNSYDVAELVSVSPSALQEESQDDQTKGSTKRPFFSVKNVTPFSNDIDLCVVSSDTLSTGELLRRLADDPDVVFAEPNYSFDPDGNFHSDELTLAAKGDPEGTDIASLIQGKTDLLLGLAYSSEKDSSSLINLASTNAAFITENVPVEAEDGVKTTVEVIRPTTSYSLIFDDPDSQWGVSYFNVTRDMFIDKDYNEGLDPNVSAVNPGNTLSIKIRIALPEGCTSLFIDSIGIGTQKVPYEFATGTSMSCPAVSGAAAVLASQGYKGTELASLVRSKVRIPESGALATRTGGVFDFSVAGLSKDDGDNSSPLAPAISDVTVSSSSITITGSNFGSEQGSVELSRYIVGADLQTVTANIASWADDKVTLEAETPFEGILQIVLTNEGGKHDTHLRFAGKSANVYEQDLSLDVSTDNVAIYGDGKGDWETKGLLVGLGCKLYYLPAYCGQTDEYPAYRSMRCFDLRTEKWTDLPDLPEWLQDVSGVMYEGKIVVEGATMYVTEWGEPTGIFPEGEREERVYLYDPESNKWTKASSEGMYLDQSILNDGGQLKLAGGSLPDPDDPNEEYMPGLDPVPLVAYDLITGAGEVFCDMPAVFSNPVVAVKDGTILMYSAGSDCAFIRIQDGQAVLLEEAAPDFFLAEGDEPNDGAWGPLMKNQYRCVLAPISDGFVLAGPPATGGASDTYILRDGSDKFETYAKRSSDDRAYSQARCTYHGRLFVIASAWFEPETRLFRATAMDVPEYPGDASCEENPAEDDKVCPRDNTCPITPFADTDKNEWYHDGVHWAIENGVMNGTGDSTFEPLTTTTRAMIVTMLWRMEGSPQVDGSVTFKDVPDGQWYTDAIRWAAANNIVNGYDEDTFGTNDSVTREQLATILYRSAKSKGQGFTGTWAFTLNFEDADQVSDWADEAMHWMVMNGIIQGMSDKRTQSAG